MQLKAKIYNQLEESHTSVFIANSLSKQKRRHTHTVSVCGRVRVTQNHQVSVKRP